MQRIALCDDDEAALARLAEVLKEAKELLTVDVYTGGRRLLAARKEYDLIFLDIGMQGMDGIETARMLRKRDKQVKIVYLTAYEDFREQAFSVHAFGYLVKPVKKEALLNMVREAGAYKKMEEPPCLLRFDTDQGICQVDVRDIYYLEYRSRKIRMKTKAGDLWMKGSIAKMGERLEKYDFAVPHKSFVVNLYQIRSLKGYDIVLADGSVLPLSQKKSAVFREKLSEYLAKQL